MQLSQKSLEAKWKRKVFRVKNLLPQLKLKLLLSQVVLVSINVNFVLKN